jgi:peroxiredoxin
MQARRTLLLMAGFAMLAVAVILILQGGRSRAQAPASVLDSVPQLSSAGAPEMLDLGAAEALEVGARAPGFTLPDLDGNEISLANLRGQAVIINFWATWCAPCLVEMPALEQAYQERKDDGLVILAVNRDEDRGAVERFFYEDLKLTFTPLLDDEARVNDQYRVFNLPTTYFVDRDGIIRGVHRGVLTLSMIDDYLQQTEN